MRDLDRKKAQLAGVRSERMGRRRTVSLLGALVVVATAVALMAPAISMTRGELVCGLEEHQHSDACYEQVLTCGYDDATVAEADGEEAAHVHTDACYEQRLTCEKPEHTHSSACYAESEEQDGDGAESQPDQSESGAQENGEAVEEASEPGTESATDATDASGAQNGDADAGDSTAASTDDIASDADTNQDEQVTESANEANDNEALVAGDPSENEQGAEEGASESVDAQGKVAVADAVTDSDTAAKSFSADVEASDGSIVGVNVEAEEGAFVEDVTMKAELVTDGEVIDAAKAEGADALGAKVASTRALAVDITFYDAEGNPVEPVKDVRVSLKARQIADQDQLAVVHVDDEANAELVESSEIDADASAVTFDANAFSVYAVVYTVDFHWEIDGNVYDLSIPGGGFVSLEALVEVLGVGSDNAQSAVAGEGEEAGESDGNASAQAQGELMLGAPHISKTTKEFVAAVDKVEFSNPDLVWVGKAATETTLGALKDENGLMVDYSAELTEEQIAELNNTKVASGDWALISLVPFDTEESLTVTMSDGEQFVVKVTDARKPKLTNTYGRIKIVKEWYDADGNRIEAPTLDDTYTSDFILTAYEYTPSDIVRLHFVDSQGNEDSTKTVIVPTGNLQLTLYNTPANAGTGYLFSESPSADNPIENPYNNINLLTDVSIQSKSAKLDSGETINYWVMNLDLNDYANELTDVYLGIMQSDDESGIGYFTTGTYPDRTADVSGNTKAMNIAYTDSGRWQGDTYRNRHIWDTIKGTNNEYTLQNQDLELTSPGGSNGSPGSFFGYTIVENAASAGGANNFTTTISWNNGVDTVYSNGLTGWNPSLYLTTPNANATVVVKNQMRADVDVPVEKHWSYMDEHDDAYDWEAKFVLQWAPLYEGEGTPSTEFVEVEPRQYVTITEAMMDDFGNSFADRSFKNLPLYGEDENGRFRYEYSVEEESYTIKSHTTGEVLATYDRHAAEGEQYTGTLPHFAPFYPHDAGELSANPNDYMVMVVNGQAHGDENPAINITVNKLWEDEDVMEDDNHDYKAYVKIQRYDQQSTRKIQDYDPNTMVEIKFFDENGDYVKSEFVEKGVQQRLHITWNSYGYNSSSLTLKSSPNVVSFSENGHQCGNNMVMDSYTDWFYPVNGMQIRATKNVWNEQDSYNKGPAVNLKSGLELLDEQTSVTAVPDNAYNNDPENVFTLSLLENRWSTIITDLPLEEVTIEGDTQTIHHYSYYFVEDPERTTPSGYVSSYVRYDTVGTEHEIELGDNKYRINYDGEHVTIKNTKETLRIRKEWRGVAKSDWALYPDSVFDLYGTNGSVNQVADGTLIRSGIHLNKTNNWEWMPEDEDGFTLPPYQHYYVVERTDLMGANAELGTPAWDNKYEIWMYYNEKGEGNNNQPWKAWTDSKGTITILNALHSSEYLQIDLKKKWMEWGTPTSWDTTTGVYKRLHDLVMGFVVYRRVWDAPVQENSQYPSDHIISPGPMGWSDYGNEILVGYDSNGHRVLDDGGNTFELINGDGGNWHWTIKNQDDHNTPASDQIGLTSEGWYTKPNGEVVWAYYEYTVRETGIWKNLKKDPVDDPEISWFSNSVPMASRYKGSSQHRVNEFNRDIGQDQDRLMNGQAFDMWVEKDWVGGAWDAREVYVKIYRKLQQGGTLEDFTEELARDISIGSLTGYLGDGYENMIDVDNKWIVFTPGKSRLYIDKVLKTHPNASGTNPYDYWIQEVGYKDKHGAVHMYTGNGSNQSDVNVNELLKLKPVYSAGNGAQWTTERVSQNNPNNGIVLGDKGTNHLKVTNTPVRDFAVIKKWQDATGEDINAPNEINQITIGITQIRTARIGGDAVTQEVPVTFGGNQKLTITKDNSNNRVALVAQNYPNEAGQSQNYTATVTTDTSVGQWALYISGLEERYYDANGVEWVCTYRIDEDPLPNPPGDRFVTEISYDGIIDRDNRNITIKNVEMEGGALKAVKEIAEGSDYDTEDPFEITVTLTPPLKPGTEGDQGKREDAFHPGQPGHEHQIADYIEVDEEGTILIGQPVVSVDDNNVVTIKMTLAGRGSFTIRNIRERTAYAVAETSAPSGWKQVGEVTYSNSGKTIVKRQLDTATITNEQSEEVQSGIKIIKIDETTRDSTPQTKLGAAEFKLYKNTGTAGVEYTVFPDAQSCTKQTSSEEGDAFGTLVFEGLPDGQYKIVETKQPAGYVKNEANDIYFDIVSGVLTRYNGPYSGNPRTASEVIAESQNVIGITNQRENSNPDLYATFTVGNTPGSPLPITGGMGVTLLYVFGAALVFVGVSVLLRSRRRE